MLRNGSRLYLCPSVSICGQFSFSPCKTSSPHPGPRRIRLLRSLRPPHRRIWLRSSPRRATRSGGAARDFTLGSYSEYHSGGIYIREPLRLRQFPVVEITRVASNPRPALLVQNVDAITNQRATVETTTTGIRLLRVASAVTTVNDLANADLSHARFGCICNQRISQRLGRHNSQRL